MRACSVVSNSFWPPGSPVHGIILARILERVAISCSWASSWPRDRACVSCLWILYRCTTWKPLQMCRKCWGQAEGLCPLVPDRSPPFDLCSMSWSLLPPHKCTELFWKWRPLKSDLCLLPYYHSLISSHLCPMLQSRALVFKFPCLCPHCSVFLVNFFTSLFSDFPGGVCCCHLESSLHWLTLSPC